MKENSQLRMGPFQEERKNKQPGNGTTQERKNKQPGNGTTQERKNKQPGNWDHPRTQEQTAREWDPKTHESLVMVDSGASVNVCPKWFRNTKLEQSVEEQTENRSKNTERDGSV